MLENKKKEIIEISKKMKEKGFLPGFSGNISIRVGEKILITPSGLDKSKLKLKDISIIDLNGRIISGLKPSSEYRMHINIYKIRKDIKSVVHTHPPLITALSCSNIKVFKPLLSEFVIYIGKLHLVPYNTPGSIELANSIKKYLKNSNSLLLKNHGLICFAKNIYIAAALTEEIEHFAKVYLFSLMLGNISYIPKNKINELYQIRNSIKKAGIL